MEEYLVEKIERKRIVNGCTQYYLKWKGYPRSENTWEPVEHLYCYELIAEFEKSEKRLRRTRHSAITNEENKETGFDRGLQAEKILGATDTSGSLMFLVSWKNSKRTELVPAKVANVKCPQLVIKFYEERLTWIDYGKKDTPPKPKHKVQKEIKREFLLSTEDDVI